jgi:hypothetical protein
MRSFLIAALAAAALSATPAGAATRNFGITSFEKVRIEGPFRVTLHTGVAPYARAVGSQAALDRVDVDTSGNTLTIRSSLSAWGGYKGQDSGTVEIVLGTHDLSSAWMSGSGTIAIDRVKGQTFDLAVNGSGGTEIGDVRVDQLSVSLTGTASARLAGQAGKVMVQVRGVSSLAAGSLNADNAVLNADGAATIEASVSDTVKVNASGPATVRLGGRPSCTLKVSGSAEVSGCR